MSTQLQVIENKLTSPDAASNFALSLNLDPEDDRQMKRAMHYAHGVLAEVMRTQGGKADLTQCNPDSIMQSAQDAARMGLHIDKRQHAHLVKRGNNVQLEIGYRGYMAKIKEVYPDAEFRVEPIYDGDDLQMWDENGFQNYALTKKDPFRTGQGGLKGVLVAVSYTDGGRMVQHVKPIPKERIDRAQKAAQTDYVWKSDYLEKAKAAAIKSACKHIFAGLTGLERVVSYDNEKNHNPELPAQHESRGSIVDNINKEHAIEPPTDPADDEPVEAEVVDEEPVDSDLQEIIDAGYKAAHQGLEAYIDWKDNIDDETKQRIVEYHKEWLQIARDVDENQNE